MKIIQIVDHLSGGGGVNSFVYDLCYALKEKGCDVSLIGIQKRGYNENPEIDKLRKKGIRVECIGAQNKKDAILHCIIRLRNEIRDICGREKTICNLHLKLSVLMGTLATVGMKNVKCIETYHNTYHHYHLQCWMCSPFIKKYICVSETAKEEMHHRFKTPYKKLVAIPNGVSRERIRELAKVDEHKCEDKKINVVSIGRLSYEKNFLLPVTAFLDICCENITYTLVGGGPQENEIRKIASKNSFIYMTGSLERNEALQILTKADIIVMPSLWEGRSILQLEAMALDKPMIISDVPGLREPFKELPLTAEEKVRVCRFGYLVSTNDRNAYCAAIKHFIDNRNRSIEISSYLKEISVSNDLSKMAEKYLDEYNKVAKTIHEG